MKIRESRTFKIFIFLTSDLHSLAKKNDRSRCLFFSSGGITLTREGASAGGRHSEAQCARGHVRQVPGGWDQEGGHGYHGGGECQGGC